MNKPTPPILVLKKGTASQSDIKLIRKAGIAVIEVLNTDDSRYMEPPLGAISGVEKLCVTIVKTIHESGVSWSKADVNRKLAELVMSDALAKQVIGQVSK